jgi:hypothetical protein
MKPIQIAYEILSESRKLRETYKSNRTRFNTIHANMYSIFECYAHGIIDWEQVKTRYMKSLLEYAGLYSDNEKLHSKEKARVNEEYKRVLSEWKIPLDEYKKLSETKMTNTLVSKKNITESVAQSHSKAYFNRMLNESDLTHTARLKTWERVMEAYPNLTASDEARVRMLTIMEAPTMSTTQLVTTVVEDDFVFNPRAGHRDQPSHPENRGLTRSDNDPGFVFNPRAGHRDQPSHPENRGLTPSSLAPSSSPRPKLRPDNLAQRASINNAVRQAMGEAEGGDDANSIEQAIETSYDYFDKNPPRDSADRILIFQKDGKFKNIHNQNMYHHTLRDEGWKLVGRVAPDRTLQLSKTYQYIMGEAEGEDENIDTTAFDATSLKALADLKVRYPHAKDTFDALLNAYMDVKTASIRDDNELEGEIDQNVDRLDRGAKRIADLENRISELTQELADDEEKLDGVRDDKKIQDLITRIEKLEKEHAELTTEDVSDEKADEFHRKLDKLVHAYLGHSSDEKEAMDERKMSKSEKAKEKRLKKKYDDSSMKDSMKDQYGDDWEDVYYATIRKRAMENFSMNEETAQERKKREDAERKKREDEERKKREEKQASRPTVGSELAGMAGDAISSSKSMLQKSQTGMYSLAKKNESVQENTTAGSIATVANPMGNVIKRKGVAPNALDQNKLFDENKKDKK